MKKRTAKELIDRDAREDALREKKLREQHSKDMEVSNDERF